MAASQPLELADEAQPMGLGTSTEEELLGLEADGALDITTEQLSLAGVEQEIEAFGDSEVLRAILDQGAGGAAGCGRQRRRKTAAAHGLDLVHC